MMPIVNGLMLVLNGSVLASLLAKVTVVLTVALACTRLGRRSPAAVRHVFLAAAFAAILALPIGFLVAPTIRIPMPVAVQKTVSSTLEEIPYGVSSASHASTRVDTGRTATSTPEFSLFALLLAAWMIVSIAFLLPIGAALWQMRLLRRTGRRWAEGQSTLETLAIEAGIHRRIKMLLHEAVSGPMTCGVAHPTVLLPLDAPAWAEEDLRRAIIHELEHVRRGDWVTQCFARAVCACYWFHPLVWIGWRRLVLEAERACDDAVLRREEATAYADQLVALAKRLSSTSNRPLLAMANPGDLAMRVRAVLDPRQRRGRAGSFCLALTCATAALFVIAVSSLEIVSAPLQAVPQQGNATSAARLQFDAASLRPIPVEQVRDDGLPIGLRCRGADGELFPQPDNQRFGPAPQGRCTGRDNPKSFIREAYDSPLTIQFRVIGFPAEFEITSATSLFYQIQAVAPHPSSVTSLELQEMLQTLLMDRFNLKVHRETREVDGFLLTVAKGGIKFKETSLDEQGMSQGLQDEGRPLPPAGGIIPAMIKGRFGMKQFARGMPSLVGFAPVADKTGLPGVYDITFLFDVIASSGVGRGGGGGPPQYSTSIPKALEEQLGLHLVPAKVPVEFLFIDHIEKPTEN